MKKFLTILLALSLSAVSICCVSANANKQTTGDTLDIGFLYQKIKEEQDIEKLRNLAIISIDIANTTAKHSKKTFPILIDLTTQMDEYTQKNKDLMAQPIYEYYDFFAKGLKKQMESANKMFSKIKTTDLDLQ